MAVTDWTHGSICSEEDGSCVSEGKHKAASLLWGLGCRRHRPETGYMITFRFSITSTYDQLPPAKAHLLEGPQLPKTVPPSGNQVFKYAIGDILYLLLICVKQWLTQSLSSEGFCDSCEHWLCIWSDWERPRRLGKYTCRAAESTPLLHSCVLWVSSLLTAGGGQLLQEVKCTGKDWEAVNTLDVQVLYASLPIEQ